MITNNSQGELAYKLDLGERQEFAHWLDRVIISTEPEDVTGQIFVHNFIMDDKLHRLTSTGLATAIMRRHAYNEHVLTDVIIENDDIIEANAKKGIFFDVTIPALGEGYPIYETMFIHETYSSPRYSNTMYAEFRPPNAEQSDYMIDVRRALARGIKSKSGVDYIRYTIPADEDNVEATIAIDPIDITGGVVRLRPLRGEDLPSNSLQAHVRFIAEVTGIKEPEFFDQARQS